MVHPKPADSEREALFGYFIGREYAFEALPEVVRNFEAYKKGERHASKVAEIVRSTIETQPRVRVDYVSIVDAETLEKLDKLDERPILVAVAAYVGKTRLIDNAILNKVKKDAAVSKA